jgi:thioredoxin reductase (NADPH)
VDESAGIVIIGAAGDPRVRALVAVAARSGRTYAVLRADGADGRTALEAAGQDGSVLPVVVVEGGSILLDPIELDLIEELGFPRARAHTVAELAVVGAGVTGLAAAVAAAARVPSVVVVDPTLPGGSLDPDDRIIDYLGFPDGLSGRDLVRLGVEHARRAGVRFLLAEQVEEVLDRGDTLLLVLTSGATVACRALVVATGGDRRPAVELSLPGVVVAEAGSADGAAVAVGAGVAAARRALGYLAGETTG